MRIKKALTKPSKQRKRIYNAPDQIRYKLFAAPLSPKLSSQHHINSIPVRTGDTVRVMRGDRRGFEGKISRLDKKRYGVYVEGLNREKVDGSSSPISIHPSKVMITNLKLDDKWRKKILERKKKVDIKVNEPILEKKDDIDKKNKNKSNIKQEKKSKSKTVGKKNLKKRKTNLKNKKNRREE